MRPLAETHPHKKAPALATTGAISYLRSTGADRLYLRPLVPGIPQEEISVQKYRQTHPADSLIRPTASASCFDCGYPIRLSRFKAQRLETTRRLCDQCRKLTALAVAVADYKSNPR